jgi:phosphoribosylaminoimidazole-succinocarboxamide synthase
LDIYFVLACGRDAAVIKQESLLSENRRVIIADLLAPDRQRLWHFFRRFDIGVYS